MALKSNLFANDSKLEAAAIAHPSHITPGAKGAHVAKIQGALMVLDGADIAKTELAAQFYGPSTAAAVLAFKRARDVVNRSYQQTADNIVGIMTIKQMDEELAAAQVSPETTTRAGCERPISRDLLGLTRMPRDSNAFVNGSSRTAFHLRVGLPKELIG